MKSFYYQRWWLLLPLCWLIQLTGCKNSRRGELTYDHRSLKVSFADAKDVTMSSDIIDSIEYIELQRTDKPIGTIEKMIVSDHKIIIWDQAQKFVWIFNDKGRFIGKVANFGIGHDKVSDMMNISFTAPDRINIIDSKTRSVKRYDLNGKFLSSAKLGGYISDYQYVNGINYSFYYSWLNPRDKYFLNVEDSLSNSTGYLTYNRIYPFLGKGGDFLLRNKSSLYLRLPYNDTLFQISEHTMNAKYVYDFGKNRYPTAALDKAADLGHAKALLKGRTLEGNISNVVISDKYIIFDYDRQSENGKTEVAVAVHNLRTDSLINYRALAGTVNTLPNYPSASDGDFFYATCRLNEIPGKHDANGKPNGTILMKYRYKF